MLSNHLEWKTIRPPAHLHDFVESFWMVANRGDKDHQVVVLPDGRFDIIFSITDDKDFHATLRGLDTEPEQSTIPARTLFFAVSFKLLAIEYVLDVEVKSLLNEGIRLTDGFWEMESGDLNDFARFTEKLSAKISSLIKPDIVDRKKLLFNLIYSSNGSLSVKELSEKVFWTSRQINRYFNQQFGLSLKAYCNIFRFRSSLPHIKKGKLFPELNFSDQAHFIKEVKKMAGVTPKELSRNENDRFILLSAIS